MANNKEILFQQKDCFKVQCEDWLTDLHTCFLVSKDL